MQVMLAENIRAFRREKKLTQEQLADVLLVNKMDAAAFFDFDLEALTQRVHAINSRVEIIPISAKTGEGMDRWCAWLEDQVAQWKK